MKVVVAGASGFLGSHLVDELGRRGHEVIRLVRRPAQGGGESTWDPYAGTLDRTLVRTADVVVNLAGSPTAGNPHSPRWRRELRESRVTTTRLLAETVAAADTPPAFLAGNGISFYGDHGDEVLTEDARSHGDALLTDVTREWQAATEPAAQAGARVVVLRTAPVLDRRAAPLKQLRLLFSLGLGGRLGGGHQYFPVISLRDWVGAVTHLVDSDVAGPVNLCCPDTPTNREFTAALASAVRRPAVLPVPSPLLRVAAGALAPEVLGSVNARPQVLVRDGYAFRDRDVRDVVAAGLA
ncbi:TIGR01777 family oxidoreductase [Nocardioides perillae]|uniref:TIGR01777 family protein n=1 Tax=Nocardioides perillae TaxID=1119534 RepID=A0A7Y9RS65_9ACTN|nr:hypothetical protein [Nocardioides perillae]